MLKETKTEIRLKRKKTILLFLIITIVVGAVAIYQTVKFTQDQLRKSVLEQAVIVSQSINKMRLTGLRGSDADLNSQDYLRLKKQLFQIRSALKTCRFLYIMGRKKDGTVFFFLDSQTPGSNNYAPPGLIYEEVPDEYLNVFDSGKNQTVGPITDRWGTLITSLVPLYKPGSKELTAVLGMDIEAGNWKRIILRQCMLPFSLTFLIMLLFISIIFINYNRHRNREQYRETKKLVTELKESAQQIETLQGLLPICSSCKRIRDDNGYWNKIEGYIQEHSKAEFTHSICPECAKKLYPEIYKKT